MLFEAPVSRLDDARSDRLKYASYGGLFVRIDGFVATTHAHHRAVSEVCV